MRVRFFTPSITFYCLFPISLSASSAGTNPFVNKGAHQGLRDGEEPGTYEVFVSLTGMEAGLGANQLAVLHDPTTCVHRVH